MNAYRVLGIEPGASRDTVRRAYRALCLKYHPDKHGPEISRTEATRRFIEVTEAYKKIMADDPPPASQAGPDITDLLIEALSSYIRSMLVPTKPDPIIIPVTISLSEIMVPVMRKFVVRVTRMEAPPEGATETVYVCAGRYPTRRVYAFPGMGDEINALTAMRGDIEVHVSVDNIGPFRFDDSDGGGSIVYDMVLTLAEYVDGCVKSIPGWVDAFEIPNLQKRDTLGNVTEMPCGGVTVLLSISKTLPI